MDALLLGSWASACPAEAIGVLPRKPSTGAVAQEWEPHYLQVPRRKGMPGVEDGDKSSVTRKPLTIGHEGSNPAEMATEASAAWPRRQKTLGLRARYRDWVVC